MFVVHVVQKLVVHVPPKTHKLLAITVNYGKSKAQQNIGKCVKTLVVDLWQMTLPR